MRRVGIRLRPLPHWAPRWAVRRVRGQAVAMLSGSAHMPRWEQHHETGPSGSCHWTRECLPGSDGHCWDQLRQAADSAPRGNGDMDALHRSTSFLLGARAARHPELTTVSVPEDGPWRGRSALGNCPMIPPHHLVFRRYQTVSRPVRRAVASYAWGPGLAWSGAQSARLARGPKWMQGTGRMTATACQGGVERPLPYHSWHADTKLQACWTRIVSATAGTGFAL